jgi:hypothetical protein
MTSQQQTSPSPESGNHVVYEMLMLSNTAALLDEWPHGALWDGHTLYLATVESFLLHARSLADFFTGTGHTDRIYATHYCSEPWVIDQTVREHWDVISTEILHLTYLRPDEARSWQYTTMLATIHDQMQHFLRIADKLDCHIAGELRRILDGKRVWTPLRPEDGAIRAIYPSGLIPGRRCGRPARC